MAASLIECTKEDNGNAIVKGIISELLKWTEVNNESPQSSRPSGRDFELEVTNEGRGKRAIIRKAKPILLGAWISCTGVVRPRIGIVHSVASSCASATIWLSRLGPGRRYTVMLSEGKTCLLRSAIFVGLASVVTTIIYLTPVPGLQQFLVR
ncbi:uncharacterized protein LOC110834137 [Zootermopsis nevadensis]|uniref:uncharacterized protein LOC110834137 n=1 Tax=Zootermopsis nevadensis TaxID=136037 RepID=UPI000B8E37D4|nr:uncharacterized protein LOC110834137 [Zootermopsis nevadensis]